MRGDHNYKLDLDPNMRLHLIFHVDRLSPWTGNEVNGEVPEPPAVEIIAGEEEYEVEQVLDSKFFGKQLKYFVKWKGYNSGHNTWEPEKNLAHSKQLVAQFHRRHPGAPRRIATTAFHNLLFVPFTNFTIPPPAPNTHWEEGRIANALTVGDNGR